MLFTLLTSLQTLPSSCIRSKILGQTTGHELHIYLVGAVLKKNIFSNNSRCTFLYLKKPIKIKTVSVVPTGGIITMVWPDSH